MQVCVSLQNLHLSHFLINLHYWWEF